MAVSRFANEIDISKLEYGEVKKFGDHGGKIVYVNYNAENKLSPFIIETPWLYVPYGLSHYPGDDGKQDSYLFDLSFRIDAEDADTEQGNAVQKLHDKLAALDEKNIDMCMENSKAWVNKQKASRDVCEALYTPIIKYSIDKETKERSTKYPPTFKIKLPYMGNQFKCEMYDTKRTLMSIKDTEMKGGKMRAMFKCTGVWLANNKYGMSWRMIQMEVEPRVLNSGFRMRSMGRPAQVLDDEEEDDELVVQPRKMETVPQKASSEEDQGSEDSDINTDEDEDEPVVVPAKKRGGKK
jgi:hypothetical protein